MKILKVHDECIEFMRWRWKNAKICCVLGASQLVVTCAALCQHIYSFIRYDRVFKCDFNSSFAAEEPFLSSDIIIYDYGLFQRLWDIDKCIAVFLDGGYMRFMWCIGHVIGNISMIIVASLVREPKSLMTWPALTIQSVYAIGLLILSISSIPKFLPSIFEKVGRESSLPMLIYLIGASTNFFLTYVLWHYYWFLEEKEKRAKLNVTAVVTNILESGLSILAAKVCHVRRSEAEAFYCLHQEKFFYNRLVGHMTSGPAMALLLSGHDAVSRWRQLLGPTKVFRTVFEHPDSLRGRYGLTDTRNVAHGADSLINAVTEASFFFPEYCNTKSSKFQDSILSKAVSRRELFELVYGDASGYAEDMYMESEQKSS